MPKINKILLAVFGIVILFLILNVRQNKSNQSTIQNNSSKNKTIVSPKANHSSQENEGGNVTVTVKPKILKIGENPIFDVEFNTHSVDLSFDVSKISSLIDDKDNALSDSTWKGSPPGGHHRSGTLAFNAPLSQTKYVELIVKNVASIAERKFRWKI